MARMRKVQLMQVCGSWFGLALFFSQETLSNQTNLTLQLITNFHFAKRTSIPKGKDPPTFIAFQWYGLQQRLAYLLKLTSQLYLSACSYKMHTQSYMLFIKGSCVCASLHGNSMLWRVMQQPVILPFDMHGWSILCKESYSILFRTEYCFLYLLDKVFVEYHS